MTKASTKPNRIIAFVGMPGSGKGTCADHASQRLGSPIVHLGNMVYEEVQRRGLDNVKNEIAVRQDMRSKDGKAVMAMHALRKAVDYFRSGQKTVVFDGLYSWSEYLYLDSSAEAELAVVAVISDKARRREKVLNRDDDYRKYSLHELIKREVDEIENLEKGGPIAYADYYILNNGSLRDLKDNLKDVLAKIVV